MQSGIPISEQSISHEGRDLNEPKATMRECGIGDHAILLLRRKVSVAGRYVAFVSALYCYAPMFIDPSREVEQDTEMMRLQLLGDPNMMRQLQEVCY